jgi:limonene-1,2-epoxide hydrolase|tara:strand:+ start:6384 stop:6824 length:441 start_codon:yes stop_codon:yes gene_type:complete
MTQNRDHRAAAYVAFYEALSPSSLDDLALVVHDDIRFKDPFSDVTGVDAYKRILDSMLQAAPDIKFTVHHCAYDGDVCFMRWTSAATVKRLGKDPWVIEGMTELTFASDGRVLSHIDYWDASTQFYNRIPVIGGLIRLIRWRVSAH